VKTVIPLDKVLGIIFRLYRFTVLFVVNKHDEKQMKQRSVKWLEAIEEVG
jgi:hypothetical protein